jgi:hypothetical protein
MSIRLPDPRLTLVYRLEATLGEPLDLGDVAQGHRRIVPQTGGTFTGPEINGKLLAGASADWQILLPDGTALADIRYSWRRMTASCSTSSREVCDTAARKFSRESQTVSPWTPPSTPSVPRPRSRPPRPSLIG